MNSFFFYINNVSFIAAAAAMFICTAAAYFFCSHRRRLLYIFFATGLVSVIIKARTAIVLSMSSVITVLMVAAPVLSRSRTRFWILSVLLCVLGLCLFFKIDSTAGRFFILKNSLHIIAKNPNGIGFGRFGAVYNLQQAAWFKTQSLSGASALLAGNVQFAFNDWLQILVEAGWFWGSFIILFNAGLLRKGIHLFKKNPEPRLFACITGIACMQVFGLFYYPFHNWFCLGFYMLCILGVITNKYLFSFRVFRAFWVVYFSACLWGAKVEIESGKLVNEATRLSHAGYAGLAQAAFYQVNEYYKNRPSYQIAYGQHCLYNRKPDSALYYFRLAEINIATCELFRLIGDALMAEKNYLQAERYYLDAIYMVPNRFISRKKLADFYRTTANVESEKHWLLSILQMPVKKQDNTVADIKRMAAARYARLQQN